MNFAVVFIGFCVYVRITKKQKTVRTIKQSMRRRTLDRIMVVKVEKNLRGRLWNHSVKNYKNPGPYFFYTYHNILILNRYHKKDVLVTALQ